MHNYKVFDLHVDCIIQQRLFHYDICKRHRSFLSGQPFIWHTDIPRMQEANYQFACMGMHYFPWENEKAWYELNRQLDYLDFVASEENGCLRIKTTDDILRATELGKLGLAVGIEGAHMLNGKIERVAELSKRGVAYLTLTHFSQNKFATPSLGRGKDESRGLTPFGKELVQKLNQHNISIDVAHLNRKGVFDACRLSEKPVLCSHTGAQAVHQTSRNISDGEIDAIAGTGGIIGIMFAPIFLSGKLWCKTNIVVDHIEHIIKRVGIHHVCLGSDYDGWVTIPSDQKDCRDVILIAKELEKRGYSKIDISKIFFENAFQFFC